MMMSWRPSSRTSSPWKAPMVPTTSSSCCARPTSSRATTPPRARPRTRPSGLSTARWSGGFSSCVSRTASQTKTGPPRSSRVMSTRPPIIATATTPTTRSFSASWTATTSPTSSTTTTLLQTSRTRPTSTTTSVGSTAARWATRSVNSTRTACPNWVTRICTRGLACRPQKRSSAKIPPARETLDRPSLDRQSRRERVARRRRTRLTTIPRSRTLSW
mmetsp:Transcript_77465/g.222725  ORF Transcript_77465/g.222725 Transcript_77465/m.222725 type:complete len:217 (-) Transcript_77465:360-1010(-)